MPKSTPKKTSNNVVVNPYSSGFSMRLSNSPVRMGKAGNYNKIYVSIFEIYFVVVVAILLVSALVNFKM